MVCRAGGQGMNTTLELIEAIQAGQPVILIDSESRENEGDLVLAAEFVTPEWINFMAHKARGLICLALTEDQVNRLELPMMPQKNIVNSQNYTGFTLSIDSAKGIQSGISAVDRAHTIQVAVSPTSGPQDLICPGHVFPIKGKSGGVLERQGHTEASLELVRLASLKPGAVLCEILGESGAVATRAELNQFARDNQLKIGTVDELIMYILQLKKSQKSSEGSGAVLKLGHQFADQSLKFELRGFESSNSVQSYSL